MKKIVFAILIFLIPIFIKADYSIKDYYIDITILDNGDVNITEAFSIDGVYNGIERIIGYKNNYEGYYGSRFSSVEDISLYDFDDIVLNEIRSIDFSYDFNQLLNNSNIFNKVNNANKGEYGIYTIAKNDDSYYYKIYNPSKINKDFYINYTLENAVIVHDDIAELAINNLKKQDEIIENMEISIHIPNNEKILKIWFHGENKIDNEIIDNKTIIIKTNNLDTNNFDFRVIFDKNSILKVNKKSNDFVLSKIIDLESKLNIEEDAEEKDEQFKDMVYNSVLKVEKTHEKNDFVEANNLVKELKDEELKTQLLIRLMNVQSKVERKYVFNKVINTSIMGITLIGLLVILYQIYKKYFYGYNYEKIKYYYDIPNNYSPVTIAYLMRRKINYNDITASILNLIDKKIISFEQTNNKKDYKFIKLNTTNLDNLDERLLKFIFDDNDEITISKLQKKSKIEYKNFLRQYSNWLNSIIDESNKFYEDLLFVKLFGISYSIVGIVLSALLLDKSTYFSPIITIIICLLSMLYFIIFYKRTKLGVELYFQFSALKRFMIDFNNIDKSEITHKKLCNYFIYSIILGCSDKLVKNIKLRIEQLTDNTSDIVDFQFLINYYKIINDSIKSCFQNAYTAKNK